MGRKYKDLQIWQKSKNLAKDIYDVTHSFPKSELFGITSQMRRAAISVPANIAEGAAYISNKQFIHFLEISMGSANELITYLEISVELKYTSHEISLKMINELEEIQKMIRKYIEKLKS